MHSQLRTHVLRQADPPSGSGGGSGGGGQNDFPVEQTPSGAPRRAGSVTFREQTAGGDTRAMLDPANQSLAESLNILLKLIYVGVAALFAYYLLSGFRNIQEGQRGIRLLFGQVQQSDLEPGFRWGPPYPFGEVIPVSQGVNAITVDREFWVELPPGSESASLDTLAPSDTLEPRATSGSLITGDASLMHARWNATYRRTRPADWAQNVRPEGEGDLVRFALMRGVVTASAEASIDDLLKASQGPDSSVAIRAREIAQATLDAARSGIEIEQLQMTERTAPLAVRGSFNAVAAQESSAEKTLQDARSEASSTLNAVAGAAAPAILDLITQYEEALRAGDAPRADQVLTGINRVISGAEEVEVGTRDTTGNVTVARERVSGRVIRIVADAQAYRTQARELARQNAAAFAAKLAQFESNPLVMINQEWSGALGSFMARSTVQTMWLPPGRERDIVQVMLNQDPFAMRDRQREVRQAEARRAEQEQMEQMRQRGFLTNIGETPTSVE